MPKNPFSVRELKPVRKASELGWHLYRPDFNLRGKPLADFFKHEAAAIWHSGNNPSGDMFGEPTRHGLLGGGNPASLKSAPEKLRAFFQFMHIAGIKTYCIHDLDILPPIQSMAQYDECCGTLLPVLQDLQKEFGITLLWSTANLFSPSHYMHGAGTTTELDPYLTACHQIHTMLGYARDLGARGYVLWNGRDGVRDAWTTRYAQARKSYIALLRMTSDYRDQICPNVKLMIEPKGAEPTMHQYDRSVMVAQGTIAEAGIKNAGINFEPNHADLAGINPIDEFMFAAASGLLYGVDTNKGRPGAGWDVDEYFTGSPHVAAYMWYAILSQDPSGELPVGFNNDAKLRRESTDPDQLLWGHAGARDNSALGLVAADILLQDGALASILEESYQSWGCELGQGILSGKVSLTDAGREGQKRCQTNLPTVRSGRYEQVECLVQTALADAAVQLRSA